MLLSILVMLLYQFFEQIRLPFFSAVNLSENQVDLGKIAYLAVDIADSRADSTDS